MKHTHYTQMYPYGGPLQQPLPAMTPQMIVPSPMSSMSDLMQMQAANMSSPHHQSPHHQSAMALYLPQSPSNHSPQSMLHHPAMGNMTPHHQTPNHHMTMTPMNSLVQEEPVTPVKEKKDKNSPMLYPMLYKTKMCKFYLLGVCEKGENCPHAHSSEELRSRPDLSKTSLCRQLVNNGKCDNQLCNFAHTKEELRATPNFFKMKKCKFHHSAQGCSFGEQCRYSHNPDAESIPSRPPSNCGRSPSVARSQSSISHIPGMSLTPVMAHHRPSPSHHEYKMQTYNMSHDNVGNFQHALWSGRFLRNRQMDLRVSMDYVRGDPAKADKDINDFQHALGDVTTIDLTYRVSIPEVNSQLEHRRIVCLKVVPCGEADAKQFAEYIDYYQSRQRAGAAVMENTGPLYVLPVSLALQVRVLDSDVVASIGSLMESHTNRQFLVGLWVCGQ